MCGVHTKVNSKSRKSTKEHPTKASTWWGWMIRRYIPVTGVLRRQGTTPPDGAWGYISESEAALIAVLFCFHLSGIVKQGQRVKVGDKSVSGHRQQYREPSHYEVRLSGNATFRCKQNQRDRIDWGCIKCRMLKNSRYNRSTVRLN